MSDAPRDDSTEEQHFEWVRHVVEKPYDQLSGLFTPPAAYPELAKTLGTRTVAALHGEPIVVLLGEPGIGRTTVLGEVCRARRGLLLKGHDLITRVGIAERVRRADALDRPIFVDEVHTSPLGPEACVAALVAALRDVWGERPLSLWLSARTDRWTEKASEEVSTLCAGDAKAAVVHLAPLTRADVAMAARAFGFDGDAFLERVGRSHAAGLAGRPQTLLMLLGHLRATGRMPAGRMPLFEAVCRAECRDDATLLLAAARLAAFMVFGGHDSVGADASLSIGDVAGEPSEVIAGDRRLLSPAEIGRVLRETHLLIEAPEAPGQWRWARDECRGWLAASYAQRRGLRAGAVAGLFGHGDGRGSAQLTGCAAFALDLFDGEARDVLIRLHPEAELRSDLHLRPPADRLAAAERLLRRCEAGGGDTRDPVDALAAPGLADLLRPYIEDATRDEIARRQAIDIARECRVDSLIEALLLLALDPHDRYWLRRDAALAVARMGTPAQIARLRPLLARPAAEDDHDDLLGITLDALWATRQISIDELFGHLRQPQQSKYGGFYSSFLFDLSESTESWIDTESLAAGLAWCESLEGSTVHVNAGSHRIWTDHDRGRLRTAILATAALRLDEPEIADRLTHWLRGAGQRYILEPYANAISKRPELLRPFLRICADAALDPRKWLHERGAPVCSVHQLLDVIEGTPPEPELTWLLELVGALFYRATEADDERLRSLYEQDPQTFARFVELHHSALDDERAAMQRGYWRQKEQWRAEDEAREAERAAKAAEHEAARQAALVTDPGEWVTASLAKLQSGDPTRFERLVYSLALKPGDFPDGGLADLYRNLSSSPGWRAADSTTRGLILDQLEEHLRRGAFGDLKFWLSNSVPGTEAAAVAALNLLAAVRPESIDRFPAESWHRWIPILLRGALEPAAARVIEAVTHLASGEVVRRMIERVRHEGTSSLGVSIDLERWAKAWPEAARRACGELVADRSLTAAKRGTAARHLLSLDVDAGLPIIHAALDGITDDAAWAEVAGGALGGAPSAVWPLIVGRLRASPAHIGDALLGTATEGGNREARLPRRLTVAQTGELLAWLDQHYPESQDPGSYTGFSPWYFRHAVIASLRERATPEAAAILRASGRRFTAEETEALWRQATWQPASVPALRRLFADPDAARIHTDDDWHRWVRARLRDLRDDLRPAEVWHRAEAGRWRPASEERITDQIRGHLAASLRRRLADGETHVERTDADRDGMALRCAFTRGEQRHEVVVEVCPNWHRRCDADVGLGRLRVVPWFGGFAWSRTTLDDDERRRRAVAEGWSPESVARALGEEGVVVDLRTVETLADLEAALPFGAELRAAWARERLEPVRWTSFGSSDHWLVRLALPEALRERFGLAPEVLLLATHGEVRAELLARARREIDGEDLALDFDLMLVTGDDPRLVERVSRERHLRQCVPWPLAAPPLAEWLAPRLRVFDVFDETHPVRGNRLLGRNAEVDDLSRRLLSGGSLAVVGLRKIGKTSLVRGIQDRLTASDDSERMTFAWLDLQRITQRSESALAAALGLALAVSTPLRDVDGVVGAIQARLDSTSGPLCLVLDEFDYLFAGENGEPPIPGHGALLRGLRALAQTTTRLSVVFIGRAPERLEAPLLDGFPNPMLGWAHWHWVAPFDEAIAGEVLTHLGRRVALSFSLEHVAQAYEWTGGHPALLRQFGSAALILSMRARVEHTSQLDIEELIDEVIDRALLRIVAREIDELLSKEEPAAYALMIDLACSIDAAASIARHGGRRGDPLQVLRRFGIVHGPREASRLPLFLANFLRSYHGSEPYREARSA